MTRLTDAVTRVVVGQRTMVERLLIGLLCNGHVLLEGVPGLAKTLTVSTLAGAIDGSFARIQFTPDLLPADLVGTLIYRPDTGQFATRRGPIFANIVLADEINRAPAKVQSALLQAMQERQVTIGETTHRLDDPFLVLATQNPIEQEGTYPLPEAQVDRFMLKVIVEYPTREEELEIVNRMAASAPDLAGQPVLTLDALRAARATVDRVYVDEKIKRYVVEVVHATRRPGEVDDQLPRLIEFGASPRASIALTMCARAHAFLQGRGFVTPSDVKHIGLDVLRHRVLVSYEAEAEGIDSSWVVRRIFDRVPIP
ncbi:MAG: ATPase [Leptolyngbya sp. PLA3]|nr:MAG: ATPase [Cyanobacteria bacterium CYA]MCE7968305.1 ATPase [Leptolyngbya sp. PL-A3]